MDQNSPAMSADIHTISQAPTKSKVREVATVVIQPRMGERSLLTPRFAPRQAAQCQIPSHCVAHSWQSIFAHDMQRAKAGRCEWSAHRCAVAESMGAEAKCNSARLCAERAAATVATPMNARATFRFTYYGYYAT